MDPEWLHPPTLKDATRAQRAMAERVETEDRLGPVRLIGGADVSTTRFDPARRVWAAIATLDAETLALRAEAGEAGIARFPYVPGFLGFREVPALAAAWARLPDKPDLLMVDGHGIAHPRGLGVATQLGLVLDLPTIGVAKSLLVGEVADLPDTAGAEAPILWRGAVLGAALRLRARANPIYVSTGHRISLATALAWVKRTATGHRLPAPTRAAHAAAGRLRAISPDRHLA
jgi:deoxyribonuclease V